METLKRFSEKDRAYFAYQARQNYIREQLSMQEFMEALQRDKETLQRDKETAQRDKELAQTALQEKEIEIAKLSALLAKKL